MRPYSAVRASTVSSHRRNSRALEDGHGYRKVGNPQSSSLSLPGSTGSSTPPSQARSPKRPLGIVSSLFGTNAADGMAMAVRAAGTAEDPATIAGSLVTLVDELRERWKSLVLTLRDAVGRDMVRDAKWSQPVGFQAHGGDGGVTVVAASGVSLTWCLSSGSSGGLPWRGWCRRPWSK
jgi:hypothetical protein